MGLFDKLKSLVSDDKKDTGTIEIIAPLSGEIVNIEDVPDVVFAEKIVGDGIAIKPTGNKMVAPVDGTIGKIFETNHAFSIESDSGVELFVHFGIDTVELKGEGFKRIAEEGQRVKVGDTVIEFDLPLLEEKAKSTLTPLHHCIHDSTSLFTRCLERGVGAAPFATLLLAVLGQAPWSRARPEQPPLDSPVSGVRHRAELWSQLAHDRKPWGHTVHLPCVSDYSPNRDSLYTRVFPLPSVCTPVGAPSPSVPTASSSLPHFF